MAKPTYASLKLKTNTEVKTFDFNGTEIEVFQYLPIEDKIDLVMITLQKAEMDGVYNPAAMDWFFHLHLIYMYSNLSFTDKQKENEARLFDTLSSNGFVDKFLLAMNEREYKDLCSWIEATVEMVLKYKNTAGAVIQSIIQDLPKNAEVAADIVKNFDPAKYQEVINFAAAANGGRNISTNLEMK
jgi:hypothetical protein